jgi:hypothetical protein
MNFLSMTMYSCSRSYFSSQAMNRWAINQRDSSHQRPPPPIQEIQVECVYFPPYRFQKYLSILQRSCKHSLQICVPRTFIIHMIINPSLTVCQEKNGGIMLNTMEVRSSENRKSIKYSVKQIFYCFKVYYLYAVIIYSRYLTTFWPKTEVLVIVREQNPSWELYIFCCYDYYDT